ncbi:hypothetical protein AOX59_09930 [Lentibacillus amyloliquefaciens]|uniref:Uncharacterized protein n=1 Tax=Lentibacillus amyloliquefaciens TaxID=1472767 RepID=A0A0U4F052_9BACI|nr:hypothetical protein AOX59_09930 [Lentibacillus amyloliquefaciens]
MTFNINFIKYLLNVLNKINITLFIKIVKLEFIMIYDAFIKIKAKMRQERWKGSAMNFFRSFDI